MGLRPLGTVGILVLARRFGHLDEPTALDKLNQLVDRHGLYLSSAIIHRVRGAFAEQRTDAPEEH
jgi:predicted nucleic acid-binding protein